MDAIMSAQTPIGGQRMAPTPTKIVLEEKNGVLNLRVFGTGFQHGSTVIASTRRITGKSLPGLRKQGAEYAKRFGIPFEDKTA